MDMTLALIGAFFGFLLLFLMQWAFLRHQKHQLLKNYGIPGPKPDFFAGNLYHLKSEPTPNGIITAWLKKYGDVFGYYMGEIPYVVVKDLEILKQVFIKDFNRFVNRPELYINSGPLPQSLIGGHDKRWKDQRSVISPMFTSGKLKFLTNTFSNKADLTVDLIMKKAKNREIFDIYSMVQGLTLDVIGSVALAIKTNCQENENDKLLQAVRTFFKLQHHKLIDYALMFPSIGMLLEALTDYTSFGNCRSYIIDNVKDVIDQRAKNPNIRGSDILQTLIDKSILNKDKDNDGLKLTREEVVGNAFGMFAAGYETTATSLAYTFYLLVKHQDVQERLYEEIRAAKDADYNTIQSLQYLDQVYSEVLRLYPIVTGFTSRHCSRNYQAGGYTFPKGCEILAPVWDIHHDPDLWPDPWKFDPDRFSPENKNSIDSMAYMPFGIGPRNCVGARFAQMEAKTIVFKLLRKVKLEKCEKFQDPMNLTCSTVIIHPLNGVWVKANLREA